MAAASGPMETPSGKLVKEEDFKPPEPPQQRDASENKSEGNTANEFKVPDADRKSSVALKSETSDPEPDSKSKTNSSSTQPKTSDNRKPPALSPAELLKQTQTNVPYKEPIWGGIPPESEEYSFDVLKNGTVIDNVELGKQPWVVFGRLPSCDVFMEHPSLSRHHAVVQYRDTSEGGHERGWYLYDLDSTHGTWVNKVKVKPNVYRRLRVGHVIKFGGSSRLFILQGPEEDKEPETELSATELKQQTEKLKRENEVLKQAQQAGLNEAGEEDRQRQKILDARGCGWGMGEDAAEEQEEGVNPFSVANVVPKHEHLYTDDPKKALKGFYEREGFDLPDYQFSEAGYGKHKCVVDLPVDGPNGEILVAEATVSGKKKDAVIACALEACRLLDIHEMLHAAKHEGRKRKSKNWEDDDFYDSDEDTFLDRTGTIEKKRLFRMNKSGKDLKAETYDSLVPKHKEVQNRISEIEERLEQAKAQTSAAASEEEDALEAYMLAIKAGVMDTKTRLSLKRELLTLRTEEQRLRKLVNVAKPTHLPELKKLDSGAKKLAASAVGVAGVRKIAVTKGPKRPLPAPSTKPVTVPDSEFKEEVEEDEEEEEDKAPTSPNIKPTTPTTGQHNTKDIQDSSLDERISERSPKANSVSEKMDCSENQDLSPATKPVRTSTSKKEEDSVKEKDSEMFGPALPPEVKQLKAPDAAPKTKSSGDKFKGMMIPAAKKSKKMPAPRKAEYDDTDPDYAVWMPPKNQSGDGRTKLNDKLGY